MAKRKFAFLATGKREPYKKLRREKNTRFKRDVLSELLLSGKRLTRWQMLDELRKEFPTSSFRDNLIVFGRHVPILVTMGIVIRSGSGNDSSFKIRESIMRILKEEGFGR